MQPLRLCLSQFVDALEVHDQLRLEDLEVIELEVVDWEIGMTAAETLFIGYLILVGM